MQKNLTNILAGSLLAALALGSAATTASAKPKILKQVPSLNTVASKSDTATDSRCGLSNLNWRKATISNWKSIYSTCLNR